MIPLVLAATSLLWLTALCRGWIVQPMPGASATNGMLRITMPGERYYGNDPVVRVAAYAQERIELVLKWAKVLSAGNTASWLLRAVGADDALTVAVFAAVAVLAWAFKRVPPVLRWREYIGHAAEVLWVERYSPVRQVNYRADEIARMPPPAYDGLFSGRDVGAGLHRAEPIARLMLRLIRPALVRFQK